MLIDANLPDALVPKIRADDDVAFDRISIPFDANLKIKIEAGRSFIPGPSERESFARFKPIPGIGK
jgi:hypothetical protein